MDTEIKQSILEVEIEKGPTGLGINIVGGTDSRHFPNDTGIFINSIRPGTSAALNKQLSEGDRIVSIDDISLVNVTHNQATEAFLKSSRRLKLVIEPKAMDTVMCMSGTARSQSAMTIGQSKMPKKYRRTSNETRLNTFTPLPPIKFETDSQHNSNSQSSTNIPNTDSGIGHNPMKIVESRRPSRIDESRVSLSAADDVDGQSVTSRRYFIARDVTYTVVGLATVAAVGVFVYRRFSR